MSLSSDNTVLRLNEPMRLGSFFPNDGKIDQLLRKIPFVPVPFPTNRFFFAQSSSLLLPVVDFFERDSKKIPHNPTEVTNALSRTFERLGGHLEVDLFNQVGSNQTDQLEQQIYGLKLGILRTLSTKLITGGMPPELTGLQARAGVLLTASAIYKMQDLYRAIWSCKPTDDFIGAGPDCIVSNDSAFRQTLYLLDQQNQDVEWKYDPDLDAEVPLVCGLPWYITDSIPLNEGGPPNNPFTSIYVLKLNGETGVKILYGKDMEHSCDPLGMHVYELPLARNKNNLWRSVMGFYTLFVPESTCIVRLQQVRYPNIK